MTETQLQTKEQVKNLAKRRSEIAKKAVATRRANAIKAKRSQAAKQAWVTRRQK